MRPLRQQGRSFEIASAGFGEPKPIFNDYWECRFSKTDGLGPHPDHPLEEALANAYAYNSFSFLSRMEIGFKLIWVKVYQKFWRSAGPRNPPDIGAPESTSRRST